ncbi:serine/threonine-protein phosphatase 1 regulatory subunit 10 [Aricia agestis]|uniref:serine/threonine-protein phosphatase 1 regulatory subunit 10 n=1 Tax=Aricia agestis TaxID=91739 RepID=UPI001C207AA2|nr:serine/threonine-protein phosphatase 1 regulatory subunit 10 [Aricia agestis]
MPRMDPKKLLNCLSVVLLPNGGIKSTDEVERLALLMTQYSKKLVSKCIYIQILKCTETNLLDVFMGSGGWRLLHMWLTEGIVAKNWPLVKELLELLLLCPVDIDRLKSNNCPKLVKELSKDENDFVIKALASKLVEQWLKTVKGEQSHPVSISDIPKIVSETCSEIKSHNMPEASNDATDNDETKISEMQSDKDLDCSESNIEDTSHNNSTENINDISDEKGESNKEVETLPVLKISLKNGKQVLTQVDDNTKSASSELKAEVNESIKSKNKDKTSERRSSDSSKSSSSKHSSKSKSSSDKHQKESRHSSSSRDKDKDKKRDKDRHSSSSSSSKSKSSSGSSSSSKKTSSSSKSKDEKKSDTSLDKEKSKEKEKKVSDKEKSSLEVVGKPLSPSIKKLGKIPKLSEVKREKPSISIEVRKPEDPKPKTVKTFHSKFRKHGLEEEIQPPPSRASLLTKKQLPPLPPTVSIPKRPSPIHNETPPEKKPKTIEDKPGAIKLIPPKPKPMVLQESDLFMDALNASTTNKKEPKKRKRRMSGSKDGTSNESSPPNTPTNEGKSVPPRFYQDTLDEEDLKKKTTEKDGELPQREENNVNDKEEEMEVEPHTKTINGLKGVLCYHRRKGPKKSIKWKPDSELEEIQYFELDETERVNVTKTFTDMKHLEMIHEREAFQKARNLTNDDVMEEKTIWRNLILVDCADQVVVEYGKNSKEKDIQAIRQKGTLQPLYFHKSMIPDSPFEPDVETHTYSEPTPIPLDDVTGNVSDFRNMPWPEPKGHPPANANLNVPAMFPTNIPQFPNNFPPNQFPVGPGFQGQPLLPGDWQNNVPPVMPNGIPGSMIPPVMPPNGMAPGNMPRMMVPNETMMMGPKMFGGPNPMFPGPPDGFNMPQNMFPGDFNMPGPQGPPGPDSFSGPNNFRGAMRGRANGHWRGNSGFDGPPRGRGGNRSGRKAVCIHFQRKGSCRQGDSCSFLHPGVNCPY